MIERLKKIWPIDAPNRDIMISAASVAFWVLIPANSLSMYALKFVGIFCGLGLLGFSILLFASKKILELTPNDEFDGSNDD